MQGLAFFYHRYFAVVQVHELLRIVNDGGGVGTDEILSFANANGHGRALPCGNDAVRVAPLDNGDGVRAHHLPEGHADGLLQGALVGVLHVFDEVYQHFRVGAAPERVSVAGQGVFEHTEVFNDAVVNQRQTAALGQVRVGIGVVGGAMCCPAGMANPNGAFGGLSTQETFQIVHLSLAFVQSNLAVLSDKGDTGTIIPPVLESMQAFYNDRTRLAMPDVTYNSTHGM